MKLPPIGYLISEYPATSHTFIEHEVNFLRDLGHSIHCASINPTSCPFLETQQDVYCVKKEKITIIIWTLIKECVQSPIRFLQALKYALSYKECFPKKIYKCLGYFGEALLVKRWMDTQQLTHLHVHFANAAADVALILSNYAPITFSITVHGSDVFDDVTLHSITKKIEAATFVCCVGRFAQSRMMKHSPIPYWPKLELSPLGIDPEQFQSPSRQKKQEPLNLLCVGRLVACKGHPILIQAFQQLLQMGYHAQLTLVGDGPDRSSLEQLTQSYQLEKVIHFHGSQIQNQVLKHYQNADIFILASFAESVPVSLMEAMAMELPCISTQVGGIPDLIQHNKEGLLIPPADVDELTYALKLLIDQPNLRKKMGEAGRRKIVEHYNIQINGSKLAQIYSNYLNT